MLDPGCLPSKRRRLTAEQSLDLYPHAATLEEQSPTTAEQTPELPTSEQPTESSGLAIEPPEQSTPEDQISQLNAQAESLKVQTSMKFFFCRNRNLMVPRACNMRFLKIVFNSPRYSTF
jgi:hypothetical protein